MTHQETFNAVKLGGKHMCVREAEEPRESGDVRKTRARDAWHSVGLSVCLFPCVLKELIMTRLKSKAAPIC